MTEPTEFELPHGGTVRDLRLSIVRLAEAGVEVFQRTLLGPVPFDDATRELNLMAHGAAFHGWALASVLGWIQTTYGAEAAATAAGIVQVVAMDGDTDWCDDILDVVHSAPAPAVLGNGARDA